MTNPGAIAASLLLASRRSEQESMVAAAIAVLLLGGCVTAAVFGVKLVREKRAGAGAALLVLSALLGLGCFGLSALLVLAQFAWH